MEQYVFLISYDGRRFRVNLAPVRTGARIAWSAAVAELVAGPGGDAADELGRYEARTPDGAVALAAGALARRLLGGPVAGRRDRRPDPRRAVGEAALHPEPTAPVPPSETVAPWEAAPPVPDAGWSRWGRGVAPPPAPVPAPVPAPAPSAPIAAAMPDGDASPPTPIAFPSPEQRAEAMGATVDAAIERLAAQLEAGHTTEYLEFLGFFARFRRYSVRNTVLIKAQRPDATLVAGLGTWNGAGYRVRKGERGIWVLWPLTRKVRDDETGEEAEAVTGFVPAVVFDAAQLDGLAERPLPTLFRPLPDDADGLYASVRRRVEAAGVRVTEGDLPPGVQGASRGGGIVLRAGLDSRNRLLTLIHEFVHEVAHQGGAGEGKPTRVREFEAESVAFVAAAALGVEHPTARDYLLHWAATAETLTAALGEVQRLARRVLAVVAPPEEGEAVLAA